MGGGGREAGGDCGSKWGGEIDIIKGNFGVGAEREGGCMGGGGGAGGVVYVPQRSSVDWDFPVTVGEVVKMGRYGGGERGWWRRMGEEDRRAVKEALGLGGDGGDGGEGGIGELSGGQQQRVFLARALARGGWGVFDG